MTGNDDDTAPLLHGKYLPPFAALRAFEAVGRTGGIRKGAAALGLDHAVVSRHLRQLEDFLQASLFNRSRGMLTLTEQGLAYYRRVSDALVEIAAATAHIRKVDNQAPLRVWCVPGFASQWLSDQLAEFERLHSDILIELRPTDYAADLRMFQADVDIRYYGDDWPPHPGGENLRCLELVRPEIMAVASPELAESLSHLPDVSHLLHAPLLHEEHYEQWRAWFTRNGIDHVDDLGGQLLWHAHLAIAAARQGRGVALANSFLVAKDLASGALREVVPPNSRRVVIGGYYFVTRDDRWMAPPIVKFRRFIQARIETQSE